MTSDLRYDTKWKLSKISLYVTTNFLSKYLVYLVRSLNNIVA